SLAWFVTLTLSLILYFITFSYFFYCSLFFFRFLYIKVITFCYRQSTSQRLLLNYRVQYKAMKSSSGGNMKTLNISSLLLAGTLVTLSISSLSYVRPAQADWLSDIDPTNKNSKLRETLRDADPTNPNSAAGQTLRNPTFRSFNIHVKNNSNQPIQVHVEWYVRGSGSSCSTVSGSGGGTCGEGGWTSNNWILQPGEKAFVVNNAAGRHAVFSARSVDGTIVWKEDRVDMGDIYTNFNYSFNY
ncbi:hypothetical protein, partial [Planktothrix sp.]|uniref:hypothetical protein n=1 Tax=Planktothrix sp. TaxID=3088171 RepID=UPI0038D4DFFF